MRTAVVPIVVLCLTAHGFARVLTRESFVVAIMVSALGGIPVVARFLFAFPESVLVEIALIIFISTQLRWGLLDRWIPSGRRPEP